jgi:hypothetical protein
MFDGKFALALSARPPVPNGSFSQSPSGYDEFLEKCGSKLHIRVYSGAVTRHLLLWTDPSKPGGEGPLLGITLPDLRRVSIQIPSHTAAEPAVQVVLGSRHIYLLDGNSERVWVTNIPKTA